MIEPTGSRLYYSTKRKLPVMISYDEMSSFLFIPKSTLIALMVFP